MMSIIISGSDLGGESVDIPESTPIQQTFIHGGLVFRYVGDGQAVYLGVAD